MNIVFNKEGTPLAIQGDSIVAFTSGTPENPTQKTQNEVVDDYFTFNNVKYANWGSSNNYPEQASEKIGSTTVLRTGLSFKSRVAFGQGVMPVNVTGYDDYNNEIYKVVDDKSLTSYFNGYVFRNYHSSAFRDLFKFGNCFPVFIFNYECTKILRVEIRNSRHCRMSVDKSKLILFGDFKNTSTPDNTAQVITMLDEADPFYHLQYLRDKNQINGKPIAFPRIKNFFCNNDYYGSPDWSTADEAGWIEIAHKIPYFLKKAYENAMHIKWHIQIPYTYWERRYPKKDFTSVQERQAKINEDMDSIEKNLTGEDNANKAIFTHFHINESGKAEEQWIITKLDSKIEVDEKLATSAAGNSEILFSLMVNPSVLGAGMPGGPYAGNAGSGSDIREGLTVSILLSHIEKQQVLDPVELMLKFNGHEEAELKYRNTFLSTLDTGKSTESKLS